MNAGTPLLSLEHVTHHFAGLRALADFNLRLAPGELIAVIGPNGAGKTTVFNLITGVYRPTAGRILFRGEEITGWPSYRIVNRGLARTFQNIRLFRTLSVLDNVRAAQFHQAGYSVYASMLGLRAFTRAEAAIRQRSMELLRLVDLQDLAHARASSLAYGQQRRLEIVRALATRPTLLLLDEPAAGMNPTEAEQLMDLIHRLHEDFDLTILLIEHQMRVVMGMAQRIVVIDFGETIAQGTPDQIRDDPKVITAYLGEETE